MECQTLFLIWVHFCSGLGCCQEKLRILCVIVHCTDFQISQAACWQQCCTRFTGFHLELLKVVLFHCLDGLICIFEFLYTFVNCSLYEENLRRKFVSTTITSRGTNAEKPIELFDKLVSKFLLPGNILGLWKAASCYCRELCYCKLPWDKSLNANDPLRGAHWAKFDAKCHITKMKN